MWTDFGFGGGGRRRFQIHPLSYVKKEGRKEGRKDGRKVLFYLHTDREGDKEIFQTDRNTDVYKFSIILDELFNVFAVYKDR